MSQSAAGAPVDASLVTGRRKGVRTDLRIAAGVALLVAGLGWLLMSGHTYARDEETVFAAAQSLFDRHQFALPEGLPVVTVQRGRDGVGFSPFGPLQSILVAPLYGASKLLWGHASEPYTGFASRLVTSLFNPFVHALLVALLFLLARKLGFSRAGALGAGLVYGFATWAFPHSRTLFTEPLTSLLMLASFYALVAARDARGKVAWAAPALSGVLLALAVATRVPTAIVAPVYVLYAFARPGFEAGWRHSLTGRLRSAGAWLAGLALGIIPYMALNYDLFGSPFATGYGNQGQTFLFATPVWAGLYGLLVSPGKGAFWYAPPLLLLAAAFPIMWRRAKSEAAFCAGVAAIITLFHATVLYWHGGGAWGPRYLGTALPFAVLPLAALWGEGGWVHAAAGVAARRARGAMVTLLVALGVVINLLGAAVYCIVWVAQENDDRRNFEPYYSALAVTPRLFAERVKEWWPAISPPEGILLRDGFSYSEGKDGAALPRWTHGLATFTLNAPGPSTVFVSYADHRPPSLPRAALEIWTDSAWQQLSPASGEIGGEHKIGLPVRPGVAVKLRVSTWNPAALKLSDRDEDLGVQILGFTDRDDRPLQVAALPQIPPMPPSGFGRWAWFYRADYHHAVDHWAWYLAASDTPAGLAWRLAALVILLSAACIAAGMWLLIGAPRRGRVD